MQAVSLAKDARKVEANKGLISADRKGNWEHELSTALQAAMEANTIAPALEAKERITRLVLEACGSDIGVSRHSQPASYCF